MFAAPSAAHPCVGRVHERGELDRHQAEISLGIVLSGFIAEPGNPLSRMTAASLGDLGYQVDLDAAEPYVLPNLLTLAEAGALVAHVAPIDVGIALPVIPMTPPPAVAAIPADGRVSHRRGAPGRLLERPAAAGSGCLVLLGPVPPARIRAAHHIQDVRPAAWLDARVAVAPGRRSTMRLGERRSRGGIDTQVHPVLVQRGDLVGSHEAPASPGAHHDSVKDVFRGSGDDVVDRTHLLAIRGVNRNALVKHLVGDRKALVHPAHTTVAGARESSSVPRPDVMLLAAAKLLGGAD